MSNGSPNLLREVERMVLLLENREWTDTNPRHPLAERLEAALHDLHDEACKDECAGADAVRDAGLEEAAAICDSVDNYANPMTANDCADAIRALKVTPAAEVEACEHSDHVRPVDRVCIECGEVVQAPTAAVADDEDIIAGIIANHAFHDSEHGNAAMDRWQMRDAAKDILAHFATAPQLSGNPGQVADCWSDNEGDSWRDSPDDCDFLDGLKVGDEYELQASIRSWPERFRITKAPDETSDDYEVERVGIAAQPSAQAQPLTAYEARIAAQYARDMEAPAEPTPQHYAMAGARAAVLKDAQAQRSGNAGELDTERLDFLSQHEAWIGWSKDGECCRVFHRNEDGDNVPFLGWGAANWLTARKAIDAAIAASNGAKP